MAAEKTPDASSSHVYIVWHEDYEQSCIIAIFTTEEAARECAGDSYRLMRHRLDDPEAIGEWDV